MQRQTYIRHYSRKPKPVGTLAGQADLLIRFANLRDEDAEKFRGEHPEFLLHPHLLESGWEFGVTRRLGLSERVIAHAKAIADAQPNPALWKRDVLRRIWRSDEDANDYVKLLLYSSEMSPHRVEFNWKRGEIVYQPQDNFERAVYALFRNSGLAKVCENADCPAPYFIARRRTQRYCGEDCALVFQKQWKKNWWGKTGSKLRKRQRAKKRKAKKEGRS